MIRGWQCQRVKKKYPSTLRSKHNKKLHIRILETILMSSWSKVRHIVLPQHNIWKSSSVQSIDPYELYPNYDYNFPILWPTPTNPILSHDERSFSLSIRPPVKQTTQDSILCVCLRIDNSANAHTRDTIPVQKRKSHLSLSSVQLLFARWYGNNCLQISPTPIVHVYA